MKSKEHRHQNRFFTSSKESNSREGNTRISKCNQFQRFSPEERMIKQRHDLNWIKRVRAGVGYYRGKSEEFGIAEWSGSLLSVASPVCQLASVSETGPVLKTLEYQS